MEADVERPGREFRERTCLTRRMVHPRNASYFGSLLIRKSRGECPYARDRVFLSRFLRGTVGAIGPPWSRVVRIGIAGGRSRK